MPEFFFVRIDRKYIRIAYDELIYVEACKNYTRLVTQSKQYIVLISMKQVEAILPSTLFCRVHRSYIVSINRITSFEHETIWLGEKEIPLSATYKDQLMGRITILASEARSIDKYVTLNGFAELEG